MFADAVNGFRLVALDTWKINSLNKNRLTEGQVNNHRIKMCVSKQNNANMNDYSEVYDGGDNAKNVSK